MLRDSRRRSPESSRRRRAERRHSREQLAAVAVAGPPSTYIPAGPPGAPQYTAMIPHPPHHRPSNVTLRSRADSSTSNTSSTSSSLLNISRKPRGFGIRSFFTSSSKKKNKKKRRAFRSKNSSSSSLDSDLAYGKGYIPKSAVNSPRHAPAHGSYRDASAPVLGPDGRPVMRRAQTDEEILEIGRQLSLYARAENDKDLMRAGRSRPSQVAAAVAGVAAIGKLSRHNTSDSHGARGIGSSKLNRRHDSDDSDWESASDDDGSSSDDFDAGLAYGSAQFSNIHLPQTSLPTHTGAPTIISQPPPEDIRPPNRKASAVDPAMFGPVNSLRGYINTPCGFRPGEYQRPQPLSYDAVPQSSSASIEASRQSQQPMRNVYPVPTSDPGRFETTGSVISGYTQHPHEGPVNVSRPAPVPIQAPKPIVPVSTRVLEARRLEEEKYREREDRERKERRKSDGPGLAEAALAGVAAATIGGAVLSSSRDKREREKEERRAEKEREIARQRDEETRRLDEERELARKREKDARRVVEEREKEARRLSEERALADRELEKRRHRENKDDARRDDKKIEEKEKDKKRRDSVKMSNALVVDERVAEAKRKEERRRERREKQRKELEELKAQIEREKELLAKQGKEIPVLAPTEPPPPSRRSQKKEKEVDRSAALVDPFQFQVDDDAFQTPQFSTPARPLTPAVMTIEREPKFDDDEPTERERMSRKDSYEQEQAYMKERERARIHAITDEAEHSTIPVHGEVIAAVIAASHDRDRKRTREAEPTRDPIEEANRWYREKKAAEREEESQSRSHSPEPSVLEKYKDDGTEPVTRIVTPPAMKLAHDKSKYDGPNADVRIDHIITPRELHMFRVPPTSLDPNRDTPPQWKSRDPSCERERPLLNLVRPTPEPTPIPEKQEKRGRTAARSEPEEEDKPQRSERSRSRSRSRSRERSPSPSVVIGPRGEIRQAPPDTPTSKSVTWGENDTKHYSPSSPDRTAEEREAAEKLKQVLGNKKKPGSGWGDLAAAFAAAAASGTLPGMSSKPATKEDTKRDSKSAPEQKRKKERSPSPTRKSEPRRPSVVTASPPRSRSIIDDHDRPPQPGPKPPSPSHHTSQKQMPGAFADDLDFTAHVAAGLQSSGFDPDIVIEDPKFRRRDSPPGSNVTNGSSKAHDKQASPPSSSKIPYQRPFAETVTDLGIVDVPVAHTKPRERGFDTPDTPASEKAHEDEWESSKKSKKNGKKSKRNTIDLADSDPIIVTEDRAPDPNFEPVLSKKEQKKREKKADRLRDFDDESSTAREPDVVVAEAREPDWAPKLSKKEQKKRERAARDEGSSTPRETEPESVTAEPADEWKEEKGRKGKKGKKADRWEDEPAPESRSVVDVPKDDWADAKAGKKDKKKNRASLRDEDLPTPREADFETVDAEPRDDEWADGKSVKKDKKKRDKTVREEESFPSGVLVSEPAPLEGSRDDEWEEPKSSKKDKKGKKNRKSGSAWDEVEDAAPSDDRSVSVSVDAFSDLQRSAVSAQDDDWDMPSKKSKKKSKRDSTYDNYDSPSRSVAPSEISVEGSSKKDKKSKRDSTYDTYDSPSRSVAPSEVSVESSSKKDKKSKRKSTKDSYDRPDEGEPPDKRRDSFKPVDRDVDSLVSEPTRYGSKSNGSWADEVEEAESQSVVSAPPSSDRKDRSKKRSSKDEKSTKEERRSSGGGFFGLFKGTNGGETAAQKDSDNNDKQSFLGNAGILGAGAGLAGAALLTSALSSGAEEEKEEGGARLNATRGTSGKEDQTRSTTTRAVEAERRSATPPGRARSISLGSQLVDPEIVQRVIKPAIDPQYGDLLPLPPSLPGSPGREVDMEFEEEELPALPDSRPDTPPAQQQQERASLSTTKTHVRRRSAFETSTKSPSQTAIPIHFRLGQRSVPPSPGMGRSSPIHSPSTPVPEMGSVPKPRSRPNSWGRQMLGEPKPLYLVEKASSGSLSTDFEDHPYPALPPSEPASTAESPAPEFEHREGDVDYLSLAPHSEMSEHERGQALRLDTALAALNAGVEEPLGSAELTPKAERAATVDEFHSPRRQSVDWSVSMDDSFHSAAQSPVYNRRDSFGVATEDVEVPGEFSVTPGVGLATEEPELSALGEQTPRKPSPAAEVYREEVDDLVELPALPESSGVSLVDEPLLSREQEFLEPAPQEIRPTEAEPEPAPVEPMTKDRSSYLLHQTPPSTKTLDNVGIRDRSPSPSPDRKRADKEGSDLDIATGVAAGLFGSGVVAALMHEGRSSPTPGGLESLSEGAEKTMSGSKPDSPSGSIKSAEDLLTPDEFSFIPTRKGKKGRKGRKGKEIESPAEPEPTADKEPVAEAQSTPVTEVISEKQAFSEPPPSEQQLETPAQEGFATPAQEQLETPALEEFATPLPIPSSIQTPQDQGDDFFEPASSKKSKKKQKKALARDLPTEEAPVAETSSAFEERTEATPAPLSRSTSVSSKKGKKKKGKQAFAWEPEEPATDVAPAESAAEDSIPVTEAAVQPSDDHPSLSQEQTLVAEPSSQSRDIEHPQPKDEPTATPQPEPETDPLSEWAITPAKKGKKGKKDKKGKKTTQSWDVEEIPMDDLPGALETPAIEVKELEVPAVDVPAVPSQEETLVENDHVVAEVGPQEEALVEHQEPVPEATVTVGAETRPEDEPQSWPASEGAFAPANKDKPADAVVPPLQDLPGAPPETPATEVKEPEGSAAHIVPGTAGQGETLVERQQPVPEAAESSAAGADAKEAEADPETEWDFKPAKKGKKGRKVKNAQLWEAEGAPADDLPPALPAVSSLVDDVAVPLPREEPVTQEEAVSTDAPTNKPETEPEPDAWQPTTKKGKKGKKSKRQALAWEAEDSAEAGEALTPSDNTTPAESSHIIQSEELPTHGMANAYYVESRRSNEMQLVEPAPEFTQAAGKKGKKGKKAKKSQFAWEPEEQSSEQPLTESTAFEEPSPTSQPIFIESRTTQQQPTVSGSSTISELAPVSNEPTASEDTPHLEAVLRPATPLEQPVTPSSPRQVPEQSFQPSTPSKTIEAADGQLADAINTSLPDEASGDDLLDAAPASEPRSVTDRELSGSGKAEDQVTSEAPHSPTVKRLEEQPAEATNKGIVTSALSIIPSVAIVGGLFGFGKSKQKELEANPKSDNDVSPQDSTPDPATQQTGNLSPLDEPPKQHPTNEHSEQGPNVTGPTADMQRLTPADESGLATHDEVAVADTATVLIPDQQVSPHQDEPRSSVVHDSPSEVTQHADDTTKDLDEPPTQAALDQQDKPIVTNDQDPALDEAQPSDTMDWELETGSAKKKGKKGKKGRGKVQGDAGFEPEASSAAQKPSVAPDSQDATRDASSDDKANLTRDAPADATPDDEWALTSKKGKKSKKNRKSQPTFDFAEPEPLSDSKTSAQPEQPASAIPLAIPEDAPEPGEPSATPGDTPVDVEPVEPSAEDLWSEPTGKKGKKNKKSRKPQSAFDVLDTEPSGTSTPLEPTENTQTPVIPAETEDQPSSLELSKDISADAPQEPAPEEPAAEGLWTEPTGKKGKKGKKNKKRSAQDWEPEPIAAEKRSVPEPAAEAQPPETHEPSQQEEHATTELETTADDIWSEPTTKKGKKEKKKKKGSSRTSSGTATPAVEETLLVDETPAAQGTDAPAEESQRNLSATESIPGPTQVPHEQAASATDTPPKEPSTLATPVFQDNSGVTEDVPEPEQFSDQKHAQVVEEQPTATRSLLEEISTTPANLDEDLATAAPTETTEPADTAEHDETPDPAASAEPAEATDPGEPADDLAQRLPELSQTEAAAVIDDLTSDLRETGNTQDPDIDVAGGSQEEGHQEIIEPAEDIREQPASGKKGKKGKKNMRATKDFDFDQAGTAQEQPVDSTQSEPCQTIATGDFTAPPDNKPADATAEDIWEEPSAKKGKKGKKKQGKAQFFSWDEPSQDQTEEPQAGDAAIESAARDITPEQSQEEPALAVSTSPPRPPSGNLAETQVESMTLASQETSHPQPESEPVEDDSWPTVKTKGKRKKRSKGLDAVEPESAPEDKGTPSQGSEAPTPGETSVAPSADESRPSKKDKKAKNKRRVSWVLPGEETASVAAGPEIAPRDVPRAVDMPVSPNDWQAASSSQPASQEEVELSKAVPPVDQQDAALEAREVPAQDLAPSPSVDTVVEAAKAPVAETITAPAEPEQASPDIARELAEPSVPAPALGDVQLRTVDEPQHQETVTDNSSTRAVPEFYKTEVTRDLQDEPTPVPQPFEEDLSTLLPTSPYSVSLRKSKKDKKKRSSLTESTEPSTPTRDDSDRSNKPDESMSRDLNPEADPVSTDLQPLEDVLDLPQSFTLKRSKKDKKKGKKQAMPWEDSELTSDNSPSESWSTPPLAVTQLSTIMEASTEDLRGSVVGVKRLQDVTVAEEQPGVAAEEKQIPETSHDTNMVDLRSEEHPVAETPLESQATDAPKGYESDTSQKTEKAAPNTEDVPAPPPVETPFEDESNFSWSTKKDKKGKKSKSVQHGPTAPEEAESTPQEDVTATRSVEKSQQPGTKEDDFTKPSSGKKGKKAKKNKLSPFSWDEPEPASTAESGSAGDEPAAEKELVGEAEPMVGKPLVENEPVTEAEAPLADPHPEVVVALPTESLSTEPPPLEPIPTEPRPPETPQTELATIEPLANEREQHPDSSSIERQELPAAQPGEVKVVKVLESEPQQATEPPPQPEPAALQEQEQVEDEWADLVKKSKKGKKGKSAKFTNSGTPSGTSTPLVEDAPIGVSGTSTSRDIAAEASADDVKAIDVAVEPALAEPSQPETHAEDTWAVTSSKKSKKDKKKSSRASDSEPLSGSQTPSQENADVSSALAKDSSVVGNLEPAEEPHANVEEPAAEAEVSTEAQGAGNEEAWESQPTKKSKKDKKDKKRKGSKLAEVETPAEPSTPALAEELDDREVESLPQAEASEHVEVDVQPPVAVEAEPEATAEKQPEPEDFWPVSSKKSKKDKKSQGSKFAGGDATSSTATPVIQDEPSARELDTTAESSSTAALPQDDTAQADDDWAMTSSKTAKKGNGKQAAAGLLAGVAALGVLPSVVESQADQKDKEVEPSQEVLEAVDREVEPESVWEIPVKKSKKDKKGKKNASRSASGTATPAKEEETTLASGVPIDDFQVKDPSAETAAEQNDFPEFSTKKPRKDKKMKGKQLDVTDFAETSAPPRHSTTANSDVEARKADDPDSLNQDGNRLEIKPQPPAASKIEINPAVLGALRLSPDHGLRAILPHVETAGSIEPHVLYAIETPSPKLLTGSPPPKELLVCPPEGETTEGIRDLGMTESSRVSHSPPFDTLSQRKRTKTLEFNDIGAAETINPVRDAVAANPDDDKNQEPTETEPKVEVKVTQRERSLSTASRTSSRKEARDIAASYLAEKSTEAPPDKPITEEPAVIDVTPEPSARDIAAAVLEVGPKTLLMTEDKHAIKDSEATPSKVQDPPSPEARRLAASWLEHEHEHHHHESPAEADCSVSGLGIQQRDITEDEPAKPTSSRESASDDAPIVQATSSKKKSKRGSIDARDAEAVAAAGALTRGVALLADKFGGSKKKKGKKKSIDKRTAREDDMFDDPALWEGADRRPVEGSRMDENADGFWDVPDEVEDEQREVQVEHQKDRDVVMSDGPAKKDKDVVMGGTGEREVLRLREVTEQAAGDFVESPTLGRRASERKREAERRSKARQEDDTADIEPVQRAFSFPEDIAHEDLSTAVTAAPIVQRQLVEDNIDDYSPIRPVHHVPSITDFRRSVPSLPPVQEDWAEETEPDKHHARHLTRTPEVNRDSGFMSDSPASLRRSHQFEDDSHRDSGVHMKDWPESTPPRPRDSRGFEAQPPRTSGSSLKETQSYGQYETPDRSKTTKGLSTETSRNTPGRALEFTPKLREPSPPQRTPEPQKSLTKKRTTRQLDNEPTPERHGGASLTPVVSERRVVSDNSALRQYSKSPHTPTETSAMAARRSASNTSITRHRTPEPLVFRPDTPGSIRSLHSATPPLRRVDKRVSGDLRSVSLSQRSVSDLSATANKIGVKDKDGKDAATAAAALGIAAGAGAAALALAAANNSRASQNTTPVANEGRVRTKDMADVYDGYGEGRIGSPRSPTRPHSMRRRQSMQVLDLENKVKELEEENQALSSARVQVEQTASQRASMALAQRDAEIDTLKQNIAFLQKEVDRLTEVNEGLSSANAQIAVTHTERYRRLESQHTEAARELEQTRGAHSQLQQKDAEIASLRAQLEDAKEKIRSMQEQILSSSSTSAPDFLRVRDVDHFDHRCQQLCSHVQQWVLRFSKFSDMRACRLTTEINDEKIIDRLDNAVLDGSDVDAYLSDRVRRRDIFMSMTMTMIWEFVFTRYLFGMDREQRQKLKSLEKILLEVGPPHAVRQWRAITLTLLASRPQFKSQRDTDTEAVVQAVFQTLSVILPPPTNMEDQIQSQLRKVMREAVDLAIEMRTQRAEYMMLPPLQPEYDDTGELTDTVSFNASLMNERSGGSSPSTNEEWEAAGSIVRIVLFPLVVKKGDDEGKGDDEVVVSPAQVLVAKPFKEKTRSIRMVTPSSDAGGASLFARSSVAGGSPAGTVMGAHGRNGSNVSMANTEGEFI